MSRCLSSTAQTRPSKSLRVTRRYLLPVLTALGAGLGIFVIAVSAHLSKYGDIIPVGYANTLNIGDAKSRSVFTQTGLLSRFELPAYYPGSGGALSSVRPNSGDVLVEVGGW